MIVNRPALAAVLTAALLAAGGVGVSLAPVAAAAPPAPPAQQALGALPAHSVLVSSNPADGATVKTVPAQVTLTFNEDIDPKLLQVVLTGPDAKPVGGTPTATGATVSTPVTRQAGNGTYKVVFRVVSADGHPISDALSFVVAAPAATPTSTSPTTSTPAATPATTTPTATTPAATTPATPGTSTTSAGDERTNSSAGWVAPVVTIVVALGLLAAGAAALRRRRHP